MPPAPNFGRIQLGSVHQVVGIRSVSGEERGANEGVRIPVVRVSSSFAIAMMRFTFSPGDVGETALDRNQELDNSLYSTR